MPEQDIFFFLHLPRTAGTTLNAVLRANFRPEEIISIYSDEDFRNHAAHSADELRGVRLIQGHLLLQGYNPPLMYGRSVRPFTFVRDPVERLVSEYAFQRAWPRNHLYAYLNDRAISFREYIESRERLLVYRGKNFMTRAISGMDMPERGYPAKALARAKRNLESVFDFVGVQERFLESLVLLGDVLGLGSLLHERRNALTSDARPGIGPEDIALAEERNQGDRALYEFAAALFESRVQAAGPAFAERVRALRYLTEKYRTLAGLMGEKAAADAQAGAILLPKDGKL
jgi:hypothetical protein